MLLPWLLSRQCIAVECTGFVVGREETFRTKVPGRSGHLQADSAFSVAEGGWRHYSANGFTMYSQASWGNPPGAHGLYEDGSLLNLR